MCKLSAVLAVLVAVLVAESRCQVRLIRPTYRPPPQPRQPIIRTARGADDEPRQPLWLYSGDDVPRAPPAGQHPVLPSVIDDVQFDPKSRHARSLSTPGRGRVGTNDRGNSGGSGARDSGAAHPGYNRRNARSVHLPDFVTTPPFRPKPWTGYPVPDRPRTPIYV